VRGEECLEDSESLQDSPALPAVIGAGNLQFVGGFIVRNHEHFSVMKEESSGMRIDVRTRIVFGMVPDPAVEKQYSTSYQELPVMQGDRTQCSRNCHLLSPYENVENNPINFYFNFKWGNLSIVAPR
jgi:hypothetical protein